MKWRCEKSSLITNFLLCFLYLCFLFYSPHSLSSCGLDMREKHKNNTSCVSAHISLVCSLASMIKNCHKPEKKLLSEIFFGRSALAVVFISMMSLCGNHVVSKQSFFILFCSDFIFFSVSFHWHPETPLIRAAEENRRLKFIRQNFLVQLGRIKRKKLSRIVQ